MTPIVVMMAVSIGSWLVAVALLGPRTGVDVLWGMAGPLAVTVGSWALIERTHTRNPQVLTRLMVVAFAFKIVFFGAYVVLMIKLAGVRLVPFVTSFLGYFGGLFLMEALYLRRLALR